MTTSARTTPRRAQLDGPARPPGRRVARAPVGVDARSAVARFARGITTPLLPSDYLDLVAPLRSGTGERMMARVLDVRTGAGRATTVVLRPGRDWRPHRPGQYVRVGLDVDGVRQWRTYSITSAPADGRDRRARVSITAQAVPGGAVSPRLAALVPGELVHLEQADGELVVGDEDVAGKVLLVTGGSGITPAIGLLHGHAFADVVHVHTARTADDVVLGEQARALAGEGRVRLIERHTGTHGRLDADELVRLVPDAYERRVLVCGPAGLVELVENAWGAAGLAGSVRSETFFSPLVAAGEGGRVTFSGARRAADVPAGTSILDAGEAAGVLLPSGCRRGICFRCVLPLTTGSVRDLRTGEITAAGDGLSIQTCVSTAAGECVVAD